MSEVNEQGAGETGGADVGPAPGAQPYRPVDRQDIREDVLVKLVYAPEGSDFPAWMRRFDPMLAAEETNCLYHLFRMRDREHPTTEWRWNPFRVELRTFFKALAAMVILTTSIVLAVTLSCFFLSIAAILLPILRYGGARRPLDDGRLPRHASEVFSPNGYRRQSALDLWMTGLPGSEVVEAIYLERMYRVRKLLTFGPPVIAAVLWMVYVLRAGIEGFGSMLVTLTLPFAAMGWRRLLYILRVRQMAVSDLRILQLAWRGELRKGTGALIWHGGVTTVIWLCGALLFLPPAVLMLFYRGQDAGFFAASMFFFQVIVTLIAERHAKDFYERDLERTIAGADEAFATFMSSEVAQDDLGKAWAKWYYRSGRAGLASGDAVVLSESWEEAPLAQMKDGQIQLSVRDLAPREENPS